MFKSFALLLAGALMLALAPAAQAAPPPPKPALQSAVFSGGCFWCMEHDMKGIAGVVKVESGYTGGHVDHPTYADVTSETSGHYESVRVTFDPSKIDYGFLLYKYWKLVDPTDGGGQFCDRGTSYRTAIFVNGPEQMKIAEQSKIEAQKQLKHGMIVTQILPLKTFWPAEDYHRNYAVNHPLQYDLYRTGCGRDARLKEVWGG